jgi:serine protease Do
MGGRTRCMMLSALLAGAMQCYASGVAGVDPPPAARASTDDSLSMNIDSPDALRALEVRLRALAVKVRSAVVGIVFTDDKGVELGSGSGTIITADGWVLTAGHVAQQPGRKASVLLADGTALTGVTVGAHFGPDGDVGLIKVATGGRMLPVVPMGKSASLATGDPIVAFGHPLGPERSPWRPPPLRFGRVIGRDGWRLAIDAPLSPGDSGGPVFDLEGALVGVNSEASERPDLNMAATAESANARMDTMREGLATGAYLADPTKDPVTVAAELRSGADDDEEAPNDGSDARAGDTTYARKEQADRHANTLEMLAALTDPYADSIVSIIVDSRDACYGVVIDDEGHVLTKASELGTGARRIDVLLGDGLSVQGKRVAVDSALDLAILETGITDVTPIAFDFDPEPELGDAVISVGRGMAPLALGFRGLGVYVSGGSDGASRAYLGVAMRQPTDEERATIPGGVGQIVSAVMPGSGAAEAGMVDGDVILRIDGVVAATPESAASPIRSHAPGEQVSVEFMHSGERRTVSMRILRPPFGEQRVALAGGAILSRRATGFGEVIQHDSIVAAQNMGGPVVDSRGRVVGLNIARADRMKTYALSAKRVRASIEAMLARVQAGDVMPPDDPSVGLPVVEFAPDGFARLGVSNGRALGPTNSVMSKEKDSEKLLGGWADADDVAVWKVRLPAAGRYDIVLDVQGVGGGKVDVFFGDDLMTVQIPPARDFGLLRVGESVSSVAEELLVRIQPLGRPQAPLMLLRGVVIQRTDQLRMAEAALPILRWKDFERFKREWMREERRKEREAAREKMKSEMKTGAGANAEPGAGNSNEEQGRP